MKNGPWKRSLRAILGWLVPTLAFSLGIANTLPASALAEEGVKGGGTSTDPLVYTNPLYSDGTVMYAGHRSHSSHRSHASHASHQSHASHYSGTSGGYVPTYESAPAVAPATPPSAAPAKARVHVQGDDLQALIRRVQVNLIVEGLYSGEIDGVVGDSTRQALKSYQKVHGLKESGYIDSETLKAMRIVPQQ